MLPGSTSRQWLEHRTMVVKPGDLPPDKGGPEETLDVMPSATKPDKPKPTRKSTPKHERAAKLIAGMGLDDMDRLAATLAEKHPRTAKFFSSSLVDELK